MSDIKENREKLLAAQADTNVNAEDLSENIRIWVENKLENRGRRSLKMTKNTVEYLRQRDAITNRNFGKIHESMLSTAALGGRIRNVGRNGIQPPEFDLLEQAALYDAEPLVRAAITRQINLWFKLGWRINGPNPEINQYIQDRLNQIAFVTKIPTEELFKSIVRSLLKYSNAFVAIVRNNQLSTGVKREGFPQPIAGLFPLSPITMYPEYENGRVKNWVRWVQDGFHYQRFNARDIIHLTLDKEEDFIFGKPRLMGSVEDVAALRRLEENIEILMAKFLFPIYHIAVGTDERPCQYYSDGWSEIDATHQMAQMMEEEGMLITSERHKLEVVESSGGKLAFKDSLDHFVTRLYTGMGVSAVDMGIGDTANRATADNISQNLKDRVLDDQKTLSAQLQMQLFAPLIIEHPRGYSAMQNYHKVHLSFHDVDLDSRIKYENHILNQFNNNAISEDEMREELHRQPFNDDERRQTRFHLMEIPSLLIGSFDEAWNGYPYTTTDFPEFSAPIQTPDTSGGGTKSTKPQSGNSTKKPSKPKAAENETKTRSQPTNQHGTNPGPTKRKSAIMNNLAYRSIRDETLIGPKLNNLVGRIISLCRTESDVESEVSKLFPVKNESEYILPIVKNAIRACADPRELRAALVASLTQVAGKFNEDDNER